MPSNLILVQIFAVVLLLITLTMTSNIPESTSFINEMSQSYHDESNPTPVDSSDDQGPSKTIAITDDDSSTEDEYDHEFSNIYNKRFSNRVLHAGSTVNAADGRLWAIPYRFGKRAAMPYRFGKRADMHFRIGKRNLSS